jgi:hypothetical protein
LGESGMGEFDRARDTQLAPDVAVKVLPIYFVDADRLNRFEQGPSKSESNSIFSCTHQSRAAIG